MRYFLENEWIKAEFESFGAELKSLKTMQKENTNALSIIYYN